MGFEMGFEGVWEGLKGDWWLIIDCLHTENADDTDGCPQADGAGNKFWLMVNDYEGFMDYIPSGYKLYENKGETWKYGQVLTKIQNIIVSLQRICDKSG